MFPTFHRTVWLLALSVGMVLSPERGHSQGLDPTTDLVQRLLQGGTASGQAGSAQTGNTGQFGPSIQVFQPVVPQITQSAPPSQLEALYSARAGRFLTQFGYDILGVPTSVTAAQVGGVQDDYVLNEGDEIILDIRGQENGTYRQRIDRQGQIIFPKLNPVPAAGRPFGDVRADLNKQVAQAYLVTNAFMSVGQIREVSVLVTGEVRAPGTRILSGLSTPLDALLLSGGIAKTGSLRNVALIRNNQTILLDLYALLLQGTLPNVGGLRNGDRLYVPPLHNTVAVTGHIRRPGIYELRDGQNALEVNDLIQLAGGLDIAGTYRLSKTNLESDGSTRLISFTRGPVSSGEVLFVDSATDVSLDRVSLRGAVRLPGNYPRTSNSTVASIIHSSDELAPDAYASFAVIVRRDPKLNVRSLVPFSVVQVLSGVADVPLVSDDSVYIFNRYQLRLLADLASMQQEVRFRASPYNSLTNTGNSTDANSSLNPPPYNRQGGAPSINPANPGVNGPATSFLGTPPPAGLGASGIAPGTNEANPYGTPYGILGASPALDGTAPFATLANPYGFAGAPSGPPNAFCGPMPTPSNPGLFIGPGTPYSGALYSGTPYPGTPYPGTPYSGTPYAGTPYAGTPYVSGFGPLQQQPLFRSTPGNFQPVLPNGQMPYASQNPNCPQQIPGSNPTLTSEGQPLAPSVLALVLGVPLEVLLRTVSDHIVWVLDEVRDPGAYVASDGATVGEMIEIAGGALRQADLSSVEVTSTEINPQSGTSRTIRTAYKGAIGDFQRVSLRPFDVIRLRPVFSDRETGRISVAGQVRYPGTFDIIRGEKLSSVLERAGGLTQTAYPYGAVFTRERAALSEREGRTREAREINAQIATLASSPNANDRDKVAFLTSLGQQVQNEPVLGRITITADPALLRVRPELDIILEPGDSLFIPPRPSTITVTGEVLNAGSFQYEAGLDVHDYISRAGSVTQGADESRMFVILPDGTARPTEESWLTYRNSNLLPPGSTIVVPRDLRPFDLTLFLRDFTQITGQLAVTAASLVVIGNHP